MESILGIDIGTSSLKVMLLDSELGVIGVEAKKYDVSIPQTGYAEQSPELWWEALLYCLKELQKKYLEEYKRITAIGFSGQMHGLVMVDELGIPVRPAILWMDQRSENECMEIQQLLSLKVDMEETLHNRIFTGFAFPSLMWIKKYEVENYNKIYKIMQPKDYIRYKLTGMIGTEVTDASATLMFDVGKREWAFRVIDKIGLPRNIFPDCYESMDIQGKVTKEASIITGLNENINIVYGMGDQQAQSIGNGAIEEGLIICNIGTGGQISTYSETDRYDKNLRTHTFCHGIKKAYTIFGAILNGGMSLNWLKNNILEESNFENLSKMAEEIEAGSEGLIYLPYLTGERTPYMNPKAKGMFFGFRLSHDKRHMTRAVMEGVTFALKNSLKLLEGMNIQSRKVIASGGGASSPVWLQMQADIFNKEVQVCQVIEQACLGACIIAGVGTGIFKDVKTACDKFVSYENQIYKPNLEAVEVYEKLFYIFKRLYRSTEDLL
ncbi:xylulokinase [Anaerosacchariphilus polymeriproducens]|uniref:Xylulose kinase n=1 Tax=Anaerosacchariphilus polymeriproducens TaxID=1812858 RepID=A0A371B0E2_9FIRM|nr:xylulokinase [Anaerosacchariphilus polymeriproducens]RDU25253.1 xylulokinase [Anaerosacchariphilus polymeriproducens]